MARMSTQDAWELFEGWYRRDGHWIYPSRTRALEVWRTRGINGLPDYPGELKQNAHHHGTYPAQRALYVVTVRHASGAEDPSFAAGDYGDTPLDVAQRAAQVLHGPAYIRVFDRETKGSVMYRASASGEVTYISSSGARMRFPEQTPNGQHVKNPLTTTGEKLAWEAMGTVAHNQPFTVEGLAQYMRARPAEVRAFVKKLVKHGSLEIVDTAPVRYFPTPQGWERIEAEIQSSPFTYPGYESSKGMHKNASETEIAETAPILNPSDADNGTLTRLVFGAYGGQILYYWGRSVDEGLQDGFESAVEWLDEHAPGLLTTIGPEDYQGAAADKGIEWKDSWPDWEDPDFERVVQAAEADMTMIGHTTLKHGNAVPSYEWTGGEASQKEYEIVLKRSAIEAGVWDDCGDVGDLKRAIETYGVPDEEHTPVWGDEPKDKVEETLRGLADAGRLISWDVTGDPQQFLWLLPNGKLVITERAVEYAENSSGTDKVLRAAESGRYASAGAFHTAGGVIYSYDMPIADLRKEPFLVVSKDSVDAAGKLSVTTNKHIGFVMRGLPKNLIREVDFGVVRDAVLTKNRRR